MPKASAYKRVALSCVLVLAVLFAAPAQASVRLAFEYQWGPESQTLGTQFHPNLLPSYPYDSGSPAVIDKQINSAGYARLQGLIHTWWGQRSKTDSRVHAWLTETNRLSPAASGFKNALYYEAEGNAIKGVPGSPNPSITQIASDLNYIGSRYAGNSGYLHLQGRPVLFVYGNDSDRCSMVDRWTAANQMALTRFYLVLKVFPGYAQCAHQPDSWHQYSPASREDVQGQFAMSISPGFWKYDESTPRLVRDQTAWAANVQHLAAYTGQFQLATTWNEWGEGSSIESAKEWISPTGNGLYAARLRVDGRPFGTAPPDACHDGLDNDFDGAQDAVDRNECSSAVAPSPPATTKPKANARCKAKSYAKHHKKLCKARAKAKCKSKRYAKHHKKLCKARAKAKCKSKRYAKHHKKLCKAKKHRKPKPQPGSPPPSTPTPTPTPTPPPSGSAVILGAGDIQRSSGGNATAGLFDGIPHDKVITLGDNQYDSGSLSAYNSAWAPNWGAHAPNSKLFPTPGNHDGSKGGYCNYFTGKVSIADPCPDPNAGNRQQYKWTIAGWSFYSMDTGTSSSQGGDLTGTQKAWLDQQLAVDTNKCQAVYMHHPRYSAGAHGNSGGLADDWQMFMDRRVDVVLAGHDHNYQRWNRMNSNGGIDTVNGIRQFVVGTGGESHYTTGNRPNGMQVYNGDTYGLIKLTLSSTGFAWNFIPAGGSFTDEGTETCR